MPLNANLEAQTAENDFLTVLRPHFSTNIERFPEKSNSNGNDKSSREGTNPTRYCPILNLSYTLYQRYSKV